MQAYYRSALGQDPPASPEERQVLRRAMIDYGALQPSPVQKQDSSSTLDTSAVAMSILPKLSIREVRLFPHAYLTFTDPTQPKPMTMHIQTTKTNNINSVIIPPTNAPTPNAYPTTCGWNAQAEIPPLEADETFNLDSFDLSNAELEEMMINATQDFWASFPGEVGVGYQ